MFRQDWEIWTEKSVTSVLAEQEEEKSSISGKVVIISRATSTEPIEKKKKLHVDFPLLFNA